MEIDYYSCSSQVLTFLLDCRLVREELSELEIPHIYHTVARNSPKRKELENKWQTFQVQVTQAKCLPNMVGMF